MVASGSQFSHPLGTVDCVNGSHQELTNMSPSRAFCASPQLTKGILEFFFKLFVNMDAFGDQFCHPLGMGGKKKLSRAFCGSQKLTKMDL